ncbi:MAG TPA: metal ABC transporter substrate-binding protein [Planctomycetota bacterium]|nr:metal ABC transporter substrate-binding protein [Planctomycetota bacterium]
MRSLDSPVLLLLAALCSALQPPAQQLRVCATTTDLGALCAAVGGNEVQVTTFVRPAEDPHSLEARPSLLKALNKADVLVLVGRELEIGWLPVLLSNARNGAVLAGQPGYVDCSTAVRALGVPTGPVDRSQGDVHAAGNPHYLTDPLCGLQVAALVTERLTQLRPAAQATFARNLQELRKRLAVAMVGENLAARYDDDAERLALLFGAGKLATLLREQGDLADLGGWFGALLPHRGAPLVVDHDLWPYFAERFGLTVVAQLEPRPGVAPTTAHLEKVIARMRSDRVRVIATASYFPPRHAEFVRQATGAQVAVLAHQPGALPGTDDYCAFVDHNVRALVAVLAETPR